MGNFKENIDLFLAESMNDCYIKLKEVDENYRNIKSARIKASRKYENFLENLNTKDK